MDQETERFAYMMAAEKMGNLLFTMEQTIEFFDEYKIKPDDTVVKAFSPLLKKFCEWVKQQPH